MPNFLHLRNDCDNEIEITIKLKGEHLAQTIITVTFNISPAPPSPITAGKTTFDGQVGVELVDNLQLSGGTPPYTVIVNNPDGLPPGVQIDTDGTVGGIPTQSGTFTVALTVNDSAT